MYIYILPVHHCSILAKSFLRRLKKNNIFTLQLSNPDSGLPSSQTEESFSNFVDNKHYMKDIALYLRANGLWDEDRVYRCLNFQMRLHDVSNVSITSKNLQIKYDTVYFDYFMIIDSIKCMTSALFLQLGHLPKTNPEREHSFTTVGQLVRKYPRIAWKEYFASLLPSNTSITDDDVVAVHRDCDLTRLYALIDNFSAEVIVTYMLWRVVDHSLLYLSDQVRNRYYTFHNHPYKHEPRWKICVSEVIQSLPMSARALLVRNYFFPFSQKLAAINITSSIKTAFKRSIEKVNKINKRYDKLHQVIKNSGILIENLRIHICRVARGQLSHILFHNFCFFFCIQYLGRLWYAKDFSEPLATIQQHRIFFNLWLLITSL